MEERLQKYMARCGVDSRRKCEELIAQGLVEVNGEVVREPGMKVDPRRDKVKVDGKMLRTEQPAYYMHYKVNGVTTTVSDDLGRRTVMDCLPNLRERVFPVGRLDRESEGLLVLTNDGALANFMTHPAFGMKKTYRVVAEGRVPEDVLSELSTKGMRLGPVLVKPSNVDLVRYDNDNTVVLITVAEGINREVRRIFAALGHEVKKLLRIQVGPLGLTGMKRGATRPLTPRELSLLKKEMEGTDVEVEDVATMFPPGSAGSRKPAGPRGRPRRVKAPRHGKPDPATNREAFPKKGRSEVVQDDWVKRTGPKSPRKKEGRNSSPSSSYDSYDNDRKPRGDRSAGKAPYGKSRSERPMNAQSRPGKFSKSKTESSSSASGERRSAVPAKRAPRPPRHPLFPGKPPASKGRGMGRP